MSTRNNIIFKIIFYSVNNPPITRWAVATGTIDVFPKRTKEKKWTYAWCIVGMMQWFLTDIIQWHMMYKFELRWYSTATYCSQL